MSPFYESSFNYSLNSSWEEVSEEWVVGLNVLNFTCAMLKLQTQSGKKGTNKKVNSNKHTEEDFMDI